MNKIIEPGATDDFDTYWLATDDFETYWLATDNLDTYMIGYR